MRLAILAPRESIHTVRWCNALAARGYEVHLLSMGVSGERLDERVAVHRLSVPRPAGYYLNAGQARRTLRGLQPDLVHAHWASGYGTLGRLVRYHPYVLSVWGSDVYDFPGRSRWNRRVLVGNLQAADVICSTSQAMAERTRTLLGGGAIEVTPFGIDLRMFAPEPQRSADVITVGTVRGLREEYGIDILIRAFAEARQKLLGTNQDLANRMRLVIAGDGPLLSSLQDLAVELGLGGVVQFLGRVPHPEVPGLLNRLELFVATSRRESFGVAVLEASACGLPVIVSDVGGLPEVVLHGKTGLVVPREDAHATADAIVRLVRDPVLRRAMGESGRRHVKERYDWEVSVDRMEAVYSKVVSKHGGDR